jgi:hypothetical protein
MDWNIGQKPAGFHENRWGPVLPVYQKPVGQIWNFLKIKKSKKTRVHFKIFGQNRIKKFKVTRPTKFGEVKIV